MARARERKRLAATVGVGLSGMRLLMPLALLWVGAHRVLDGDLSLGAMLGLKDGFARRSSDPSFSFCPSSVHLAPAEPAHRGFRVYRPRFDS